MRSRTLIANPVCRKLCSCNLLFACCSYGDPCRSCKQQQIASCRVVLGKRFLKEEGHAQLCDNWAGVTASIRSAAASLGSICNASAAPSMQLAVEQHWIPPKPVSGSLHAAEQRQKQYHLVAHLLQLVAWCSLQSTAQVGAVTASPAAATAGILTTGFGRNMEPRHTILPLAGQ